MGQEEREGRKCRLVGIICGIGGFRQSRKRRPFGLDVVTWSEEELGHQSLLLFIYVPVYRVESKPWCRKSLSDRPEVRPSSKQINLWFYFVEPYSLLLSLSTLRDSLVGKF